MPDALGGAACASGMMPVARMPEEFRRERSGAPREASWQLLATILTPELSAPAARPLEEKCARIVSQPLNQNLLQK